MLPTDWSLPEGIRRRLGEKAGRQRAMFSQGHLLLVLHDVPEPGDPKRVAVFFWRTPEGEWRCSRRSGGFQALVQHVGRYEQAVDRCETQYSEARSAAEWFAVLRAVIPLHRATNNLLSALQSAREQVGDDLSVINLRDRAADLERATELLHSDASHALHYAVARQSEEHARQSTQLAAAGHRLNVLAAVFLPVTAIASIFGMKLIDGLEDGSPLIFWGITVVSGLAGLGLGVLIASRSPNVRTESTRKP